MGYDIVIIGGGPAGLTAALYARRAGLSPIVLEQTVYGGQVANTPEVENYPGIQSISGVDLAMALYDQVAALGVEVRLEAPTGFRLGGSTKEILTAKGSYEAGAVIIANGAKRRKLGCPGEDRLAGRGVSYCATCDGAFFRGQEVAIVGGGNTALEDALFLAGNCSAVHLIHRRDAFRGSQILAEAVQKRENILLHYNAVVEEILGEDRVSGVRLRDTVTGEEELLPVAGAFVAIGLVPDNAAFAGQLAMDEAGYLVAGEDCRTSLPGVFAAGDTRTKEVRQIVTAAADGAVAAVHAASYLSAGGRQGW